MRKIVLPALALAGIATAGSVQNTKVTGVYCGYYGGANMCSIYFDKDISGSPSCVQNNVETKRRFQLRMNNDIAKSILSIALTANQSGAVVSADGTNNCDIWGDTETMNMLFMVPPANP